MKPTLESKLIGGFGFAFVLLIAITLISLRSTVRLSEDAARAVAAEMEREENRLLQEREERGRAQTRFTLAVIVAGGLAALLLVGAALVILRRDFAARRRAEAALGGLQRHHERILDSVGEGLHGIDREGKIIFENPAAATMLGWDIRELIGKPAHSTMHHTRADGSSYPQSECHIYATLRGGGSRHVEDEVFWRKDGTSFPVTYTSTPMRDDAGEVVGAVVAFHDITERKRAERREHQIVEASPNALMMVDREGRITLANAQAENLFGYPRAELIGLLVERLLPERFRAAHPGYRASFFADPHTRTMGAGRDLFGLRKDGREVPIEIGLNPLVTSEGTFVLASIIDITERKRREEYERLLLTIMQVAGLAPDYDVALETTLQLICEKTGWVMGEVWLPSADGAHLECHHGWHAPGSGLEQLRTDSAAFTFERGVGLPGRVWVSGEPAWVEDVGTDPNFPRKSLVTAVGLRACSAVPILDGEQVVAVMDFFTEYVRAEDGKLLGLIASVGRQLVV